MGTFEDRECAQAEATVGKDISGKLGSSVRLFKFQKNGLDEYQSSYFRQVYANSHRVFKSSSAVHFGHIHMLQNIFMAVLGGLVWYQIPNDEEHVGDFAGYLFFVVIYWFFAALFDGMLEFILERPSIRRELVSGDYRLSAYLLAKTLAGAPVKMVPPWIFVTISYWMVAKDADVKTYFAFAGIVILSTLVFNSVGMFIGSVTEDMNVASSLTNVGAFSILTLGGFYLKKMPSWLEFISSLSMFRFAYRAYVQVAYRYSGDVVCNGGSSIRACYWNDDGTVNTSGVISSAQAVQFILDAEVDSLGTNIYVLFIYCVAFRIFSYLALLWAERRILFKTA